MPKFIADIGINHNQSLARAKEIIGVANNIGCQGVKLQLFSTERLYGVHRPELDQGIFVETFLSELSQYAHSHGLIFGVTPTHPDYITQDLIDHVDFLKIGSYEILCHDMIEMCAKAPVENVIVSLGLATIADTDAACQILYRYKEPKQMHLLWCKSHYPAIANEVSLYQMEILKTRYKCNIGYSDHTVEPGVIYRAAAHGASIIEFHLDLGDRQGRESQFGHCWTPAQIREVIYNINIGDMADEALRHCTDEELNSRTDPADYKRPLRSTSGINNTFTDVMDKHLKRKRNEMEE